MTSRRVERLAGGFCATAKLADWRAETLPIEAYKDDGTGPGIEPPDPAAPDRDMDRIRREIAELSGARRGQKCRDANDSIRL